MARPRKLTPSYLRHKQTGRVWTDALGIHREYILPGKFGSQESLEAKARLELEFATSPTARADPIQRESVSTKFCSHTSATRKGITAAQTGNRPARWSVSKPHSGTPANCTELLLSPSSAQLHFGQ